MCWDRIREWGKKWHEVLVVILVILGLAAILAMTDIVSKIGISKESSLTILLIAIGLISIGLSNRNIDVN